MIIKNFFYKLLIIVSLITIINSAPPSFERTESIVYQTILKEGDIKYVYDVAVLIITRLEILYPKSQFTNEDTSLFVRKLFREFGKLYYSRGRRENRDTIMLFILDSQKDSYHEPSKQSIFNITVNILNNTLARYQNSNGIMTMSDAKESMKSRKYRTFSTILRVRDKEKTGATRDKKKTEATNELSLMNEEVELSHELMVTIEKEFSFIDDMKKHSRDLQNKIKVKQRSKSSNSNPLELENLLQERELLIKDFFIHLITLYTYTFINIKEDPTIKELVRRINQYKGWIDSQIAILEQDFFVKNHYTEDEYYDEELEVIEYDDKGARLKMPQNDTNEFSIIGKIRGVFDRIRSKLE